MIKISDGIITRSFNGETMRVEAWGENCLRIRITGNYEFSKENWALLEPKKLEPEIFLIKNGEAPKTVFCNGVETVVEDGAEIKNGKICMFLTKDGKMVFKNSEGKQLLAEYEYDCRTSLHINSHELKGLVGGNFKASLKFASDPDEKLYGMGQYQNGVFNLKGSYLELAQRNSQASVPFLLSNKGYGFFWNNPAIGRATFGINMTEWEAESTKQIDFWITAGDSPAEIVKNYMNATGKAPKMPEHALGFWQCKLRYQTQDEVLEVAREFQKRGIPLDVIVIDYFHWTKEGTWAFDPTWWPDPKAMVEEINAMGAKVMVSVWPTVATDSPNYNKLRENGFLVRSENGVRIQMETVDANSFVDFTNPEARKYIWETIKNNYTSYGITDFWLDVAEPEYTSYDFGNYRYYKGNVAEVGNEYPVLYTKTFYDGLKQEGIDSINLVRCGWAGSQRYGALVWSGDIKSTFESFRKQIICGMQMAIAGIPWWTTDIGGFAGGNYEDPEFRELLVRWFQYGCFCPVMRLHGFRLPGKPILGGNLGGRIGSGTYNEIWEYGEENYQIMKSFIELRYKLKPYLRATADNCTENGDPIIRPIFYNFPKDSLAWDIKDQFMLGSDLIVAPVMEYGLRERPVYLPSGADWLLAGTDHVFKGGSSYLIDAPLCKIPVFVKSDNTELNEYFK